MPTYDYSCQNCAYKMELLQKITDAPLTNCPECGKEALVRGPGGGIGLSFQGSGFYITDYAKSNSDSADKNSCSSDGCKGNCSKE